MRLFADWLLRRVSKVERRFLNFVFSKHRKNRPAGWQTIEVVALVDREPAKAELKALYQDAYALLKAPVKSDSAFFYRSNQDAYWQPNNDMQGEDDASAAAELHAFKQALLGT